MIQFIEIFLKEVNLEPDLKESYRHSIMKEKKQSFPGTIGAMNGKWG